MTHVYYEVKAGFRSNTPAKLPVDDGGGNGLPLEEVGNLLPVQARLVEVRQLSRHLCARELGELFTELLQRELVLQRRSHLNQTGKKKVTGKRGNDNHGQIINIYLEFMVC